MLYEALSTCAQLSTQAVSRISLPIVFLLGIAGVFFLKLTISLLSHYRRYKTFTAQITPLPQTLSEICKSQDIPTNAVLSTNDSHASACTFGFFSPRIIISKGLVDTLSSSALEAVVLHEEYHRKQRHSLYTFFLHVIADAFPFLPIISTLHTSLHTHFEISADDWTVRRQGTNRHLRQALQQLLSTVRTTTTHNEDSYASVGIDSRALESRINRLTGRRNSCNRRICLSGDLLRNAVFSIVVIAGLFSFHLLSEQVSAQINSQNTTTFNSCLSSMRSSMYQPAMSSPGFHR